MSSSVNDVYLIRSSVREILDRYDSRYWAVKDEAREYPLEFIRDLESNGFMAANIPEEYGGASYGLQVVSAVLEEIASSPGGSAASSSIHAAYFNNHILVRYGSVEAKSKYLPGIAQGELRFQVYAVTEPHAGFNTPRISTFARREGDYYILNGQKIFISRLKHSDLGIIAARTTPYDESPRKTHGITLFLVDLRKAKGKNIRYSEIPNNLRRFVDTSIVYIEDLEVPAENVIGEVDKGFYILMEESNVERALIASQCIGSGRWVIRRAVEYAKERIVFPPDPIARYQGIQYPLADSWIRLEAGAALRDRALELIESKADRRLIGYYSNSAKYIACEACYNAARYSMWTMGGYGYSIDMDVERHWRAAELFAGVGQISPHMILNYVATKILGMPRSYGD
ncbi:MAG: acyl-CoA/acyl-ACP dehydrogenase [Desulfurococcales archaeon]|nr:acyl-CoA/acyl-ACP dehydrogenase [Desulfurococcales archaeon]